MSDSPNNEEIVASPPPPKKRGRPPKVKDPAATEKRVVKKRTKKAPAPPPEVSPLVSPDVSPEPVPAIVEPPQPEKLPGIRGNISALVARPAFQRGVVAAAVAILVLLYLFVQFRGLASPTAMDQAQISRAIASGEGFTTKYLRPFALWQLEHSGKPIPTGKFPDFFQSPLNPLVNALPLKVVQSAWKLGPLNVVYIGDRMIAGTAILFFLLSVLLWHRIARRLFDQTLAHLGCAIIVLTDLFWEFSLSGLPQMLMLLIFSGVCWTTLEAVEKKSEPRVVIRMSLFAGLLLGLMVLAHGASAWIAIGWLAFACHAFRRRGLAALAALIGLLLVVTPWLCRNQIVCGNPLGIAGYELLAPGLNSEAGYLRSLSEAPSLAIPRWFSGIKEAFQAQAGGIPAFLGMNLAALMFFAALLHRFKPDSTGLFRRAIVLMWLGAFAGMMLCGVDGAAHSNQLHVLFVPVFVFYGLAFTLELWSRLEIPSPRLRKALVVALVLICALPLISRLSWKPAAAIQWPPYVPPFIAILGEWYGEKEIIASDMPWAVAWYANRHSVLLPATMRDFNKISDYRLLGESITGLYLTPVTGNSRLFSEIYKGPYTEWVQLIERPPNQRQFALPVFTPLPIDGECILYADRDRWSRRE